MSNVREKDEEQIEGPPATVLRLTLLRSAELEAERFEGSHFDFPFSECNDAVIAVAQHAPTEELGKSAFVEVGIRAL
jgi:hypothetical protein